MEWGELWQAVLPSEEHHPCLFFDDADRPLLVERLGQAPWRTWGEDALERFPASGWWLLGDTDAAARARSMLVDRPLWREKVHGYLEPSSHHFAAYVIQYDLLAGWAGLSDADHRAIRGKIITEARYYFEVLSGGARGGANYGNQRTLGASALGLAAIALCGEQIAGAGPEAWLCRALYEIRRAENFWFFRPDGLFVEGLGYTAYMSAQFVPFVVAYERASGHYLFEEERFRQWLVFAAYQRLANGEFVPWGTCESGTTLACFSSLANKRYGRDLQPLFHLAFNQAAPTTLNSSFGLLALAHYDPDPSGPPPSAARAFPGSQTAVMRENWGHDTVAVWFAGKDPTWPLAHRYSTYSHADPGHFVLAAWDEVLAADSGYDHWKSRQHYTAEYHNVILADGDGPAQDTPGVLTDVDLSPPVRRAAVTTRYAGCTFRRTLALVRGRYVLVLDSIQADTEHDYAWQIRSTCPPHSEGTRLTDRSVTWPGLAAHHWRSLRPGQTELTTVVPAFADLSVKPGLWRPISSKPDFANQVAVATWRAQTCKALFVLIPNQREAPDLSWKPVAEPGTAGYAQQGLTLSGPGWSDEVRVAGDELTVQGQGQQDFSIVIRLDH